MESLAAELGIPLSQLEERLAGLADLRDLTVEFELPIGRPNSAIAALGARYKPVSNEYIHREAWSRHLRLRQPKTVELLRERSAGVFDRGDLLTQYVWARESVLKVAPDVAWFTTYDELPEDVMDTHLTQWMDAHVLNEPSATPLDLPLIECRASNGVRLRTFWDTLASVLSAWIQAPGIVTSADMRQAWASPGAREICLATARDGGWLDFRVLDEQEIARWLTLAGLWPEGQVPNPDPAAWGLSVNTLSSSEERAKAEKAELQRRRSLVEFGRIDFAALKDGYADLALAVAGSLSQAVALRQVKSTDSALETMDLAKPGGGSGGGGREHPSPPRVGCQTNKRWPSASLGSFGRGNGIVCVMALIRWAKVCGSLAIGTRYLILAAGGTDGDMTSSSPRKVARITTKLRRAQGIPAGLRWVQQKLVQPNDTGTTVSIGIVCSILQTSAIRRV